MEIAVLSTHVLSQGRFKVQCLEQDPGYSTGGWRSYLETNFIPGADIFSGCVHRPKGSNSPRRGVSGQLSPHPLRTRFKNLGRAGRLVLWRMSGWRGMEPLCNPSAGERGALSLDFRPRQQESLKQESFALCDPPAPAQRLHSSDARRHLEGPELNPSSLTWVPTRLQAMRSISCLRMPSSRGQSRR